MIRLASLAAVFAFAGVMAAGPAFAAREPRDLVRALYAETSVALPAARSASYFSRDLDAALQADASGPAQASQVGFDYRYGAGELEIRGLEFIQEVDGDRARVVAVFKNRGRANSVDWALCRRPNGDWRIFEATSNTGPQEWGLRGMLSLPADRVAC